MLTRLITVLLLGLAQVAIGQGTAERVRVPVIFDTDKSAIVSSMALEVERTDYGSVDVAEFGDMYPSAEAEAFSNLVQVLAEGTVDGVLELSSLSPNENITNRRQLISAFQQTFGGRAEEMQVVAQYNLGGERSILWTVPSPSGPFIRSFTFARNGDSFLWSDSTIPGTSHLLDTLLMQAEQTRLGNQLPELEGNYRYDEPIVGTSVDLLFDGQVLRWDVFGDTRPDLPVAKAYAEAYKAFANSDMKAFAGSYTAYSADKFNSWFNAMPADEQEAYRASVLAGREVRFILDADPVYVVFFNTPDRVDYDVLVREGDGFKLTSFYIEGFVDNLLKDRNLFIEPILANITARGDDPVDYVPVASVDSPAPGTNMDVGEEQIGQAEQRADAGVEEPASKPEEESPFPPALILILLLGLLAVIILLIFLKGRKKQ